MVASCDECGLRGSSHVDASLECSLAVWRPSSHIVTKPLKSEWTLVIYHHPVHNKCPTRKSAITARTWECFYLMPLVTPVKTGLRVYCNQQKTRRSDLFNSWYFPVWLANRCCSSDRLDSLRINITFKEISLRPTEQTYCHKSRRSHVLCYAFNVALKSVGFVFMWISYHGHLSSACIESGGWVARWRQQSISWNVYM